MYNQSVGFNINRLNAGRLAMSSRESTLELTRTHENHLAGTGDKANQINQVGETKDFKSLLLSQLDNVSELDKKAKQLSTEFFLNPESINEHDVLIASTNATTAISLMTTIVNRALDAYRNIISLR